MKNLDLDGGNALVVVAHPDDETIWMGGTILMYPEIRWTIFSLCRSNDRDRAPKFKKVCKFYGARGIISDLEDEGIMNIKESLSHIEKRIRKRLGGRQFKYIFAHSENGEYGHIRHRGVARVIKKLLANAFIRADRKFGFAYHLDKDKKIAMPDKISQFRSMLPPTIFKLKRNIVKNLYGFTQNSFENRSCAKTEAFNYL